MLKELYSRSFDASMSELAGIIGEAMAALIEHGWVDKDAPFELHLCLEEALVNAMDHGTCCDKGLPVRLDILESDKTCHIRVYDRGEGFSPASVPEPDLKTPSGRGICLIKHFMDEVTYNKDERCFEMSFHRKHAARGEMTHER